MPKARIAMHDIHEILRLRHECGRSQREIARSRELSVGAVCKVLRQAREAGLARPLPDGLEGKALEERLYGGPRGPAPGRRREGLDFAAASKDLSRRKNLTLRQLWASREGPAAVVLYYAEVMPTPQWKGLRASSAY